MGIRALVELCMPGYVELISISETGAIDIDSRHEGAGAEASARARACEAFGKDTPRREAGLPCAEANMDLIYELPERSLSNTRAYLRSPSPGPALEAHTMEFIWRYRAIKAFARMGDFIGAAMEIERYAGTEAYAPLFRHSLGEGAFLAIAMRYLTSFEASKGKLGSILSDEPCEYKGPDRSDYLRLYMVAAPLIEAKDIYDFEREAGRRIAGHLRGGGGIVAPVVGSGYATLLDDICEPVRRALREGLRRSLTEGLDGYMTRIEAFVRGMRGRVAREPWNPEDRNALMVSIAAPGLAEAKAGYLRRDLARALAPFVAEAGGMRADPVRLKCDGFDIELRLPMDREIPEAP